MGKFIISIWLLVLTAGTALAAEQSPRVWLLDLDGPVGPASADHLLRGLEEAQNAGADAVVFRIDTPGGLDGAMRDIIHGILDARIPVICYVAPQGSRAASAGTYILYACHIAAMAPATNLGAATPVQVGGSPGLPDIPEPDGDNKPKKPADGGSASDEDSEADSDAGEADNQPAASPTPSNSQAMRNKVVNDARAYIRGLAELRGRNSEWAEQAVTEGASLTASEAVERNVIDLVAEDLSTLLEEVHGREVALAESTVTLNTAGASVNVVEPDWRTRFLGVITNPSVAYILMMVGIYGLILEFSNPGLGAGGIVGAICLLLALYALQLLPISYSALGLMLLGLGLMVAEAFSPSFGILGLGGIVAFIVGSIMLMDTDVPGFQIALPLILSVAAVSAGLLIMVVGMLLKTRRRAVVSGADTMVGQSVAVVAVHHGKAMVRVQGEMWQALCDQPLAVGDRVTVQRVSGLQLEVTKES